MPSPPGPPPGATVAGPTGPLSVGRPLESVGRRWNRLILFRRDPPPVFRHRPPPSAPRCASTINKIYHNPYNIWPRTLQDVGSGVYRLQSLVNTILCCTARRHGTNPSSRHPSSQPALESQVINSSGPHIFQISISSILPSLQILNSSKSPNPHISKSPRMVRRNARSGRVL